MCHHLEEDWKLERELVAAEDEDEAVPEFLDAEADGEFEVLTDGGDEA